MLTTAEFYKYALRC